MNETKSHFYPFSLPYLAICLSRVLQRPPRSHAGRLDRGDREAAMIVIKFYSFYRYKSAEDFRSEMDYRFKAEGSEKTLPPIRTPVLDENKELPAELVKALTSALQLQVGRSSIMISRSLSLFSLLPSCIDGLRP